jgi:tetratricopeptide (TPR) repeat protein
MKRLVAIGAVGLVALAIVVVIGVRAREVRADDPTPVAAVAGTYDPTADATADERAVLGELDAQKWIAAREHAEKILRTNPDSFIATWAMANVHHYEEGNHARALYFVRRAERLLVARGPLPAWHRDVLIEENYILGEMDRIGEQLALLDRLHTLYPPGRDELRIWPLIKLRRYDDARAAARSMLGSEDSNERTHAHNGLMAVESEAHQRQRAYDVAMAAVAARPGNCIINRNAGAIAWERFKPQQAEDLLHAATTAEIVDCASSPFVDLAWIYLMGGEFQQAVAALKSANAVPLAKQYRPHHLIERRAMLADLVHALGKPDEAERLAAEVYEQPERTGMVSASAAMARLTRTLRYWLALDARVIFERERASYRSFYSNATTRARLAAARWEVRRALFQLSADSEALITITRPNIGDTHVARWTTGGLIDILGPGVMKTAVAEARRLDAEFPEATPYFDALSGEIAYRTDELAEAVELADTALAGLPRQDGLIRWYVMAWKADADWRLGHRDAAIAGYHEVLQKLPGALRILDVALPVTIKHDGSALADEIAEGLTESTRFTSGDTGFRLEVSARGGESTICLVDARGFQFACDVSTRGAEAALDAFHLAAFSPKIAVTQADLSGLDGSATSRTADQVLEGLLK